MSIKSIWVTIQVVITAVGAWLGAFLGGTDSLLYAIVAFTVIDYLTGMLAAINAHKLSSSVGFRGIARKILIFTLIGLAHLLDVHVLGTPGVLRTATIFFYLSNEGISVLENAGLLGLPIPNGLRQALDVIKQRGETQPEEKTTGVAGSKSTDPAGSGTGVNYLVPTPRTDTTKPNYRSRRAEPDELEHS